MAQEQTQGGTEASCFCGQHSGPRKALLLWICFLYSSASVVFHVSDASQRDFVLLTYLNGRSFAGRYRHKSEVFSLPFLAKLYFICHFSRAGNKSKCLRLCSEILGIIKADYFWPPNKDGNASW